ncbi:hypothetical protein [Novosphingobium sp.]|uniref:hypothetical protein n=1 Tax=Novosphingobium sp. TaxID=1874826 RepID=UPI002FDDB340
MLLSLALAAPLLMAAEAAPATAVKDADPMICERSQVIGSLLKSKKVCMRKSEWEAQRQENRMMIDRSQTQHPMNSGG